MINYYNHHNISFLSGQAIVILGNLVPLEVNASDDVPPRLWIKAHWISVVPGDPHADSYLDNVPAAWAPRLSVVGAVVSNFKDPSGVRLYVIRCSAYWAALRDQGRSAYASVHYVCELFGSRWERFPDPIVGRLMMVTGWMQGFYVYDGKLRVCLTVEDNEFLNQPTTSTSTTGGSSGIDNDRPRKRLRTLGSIPPSSPSVGRIIRMDTAKPPPVPQFLHGNESASAPASGICHFPLQYVRVIANISLYSYYRL